VSIAKYVTGDDEALLAILHRNIQLIAPKDSGRFGSSRVDTLVAAAFIEVLYSVKYTIYRVKEGLYTLIASDTLLFY